MVGQKSEAEHIAFLLSIINHHEGKVDWHDVARETGYKSGKFVKQALNGIRKKYEHEGPSTSTSASNESPAATRKVNGVTKKRAKSDSRGEEDEDCSQMKKVKGEQKGVDDED